MQFKPVPTPPDSLAFVEEARSTVPLVAKSEDDCCGRLMNRTTVDDRDDARTWLTFLRALDLVAEHETGYARTRAEFDRESVAAAFEARVFAADAVLEALREADEPLDAPGVFDRIEDVVPRWERDRDPYWRDTWRGRVADLLDWAVLLGLAERTKRGYRAASADRSTSD
ncbi:MAG: hypothetical protein V5A33_03015 [Halobacteriales archaeon]